QVPAEVLSWWISMNTEPHSNLTHQDWAHLYQDLPLWDLEDLVEQANKVGDERDRIEAAHCRPHPCTPPTPLSKPSSNVSHAINEDTSPLTANNTDASTVDEQHQDIIHRAVLTFVMKELVEEAQCLIMQMTITMTLLLETLQENQ
ncbi:hypothetical protein V5O48_008873, partial [Marasmius crinis-equi]